MYLVENVEVDFGGGNRNELVVCILVIFMDVFIFCYGRFVVFFFFIYVIVSFINVYDFFFCVVGLF